MCVCVCVSEHVSERVCAFVFLCGKGRELFVGFFWRRNWSPEHLGFVVCFEISQNYSST